MTKKIKVAILGGGVGGLSAAHELAELGGDFEVHVYEGGKMLGGKAQSQFLAGTGKDGRLDLPGEHGFRFFPAWYKHIPDTMDRIPLPNGGSVLDNLVGCTEMGMAEVESPGIFRLKRYAPSDVGEFLKVTELVHKLFVGTSLSVIDLGRFAIKMIDFTRTCEERRRDQYEEMSFFNFIEGATFSRRFQSYLNSSRFMVAMDARHGSACTIGNKIIQMMLDFGRARGGRGASGSIPGRLTSVTEAWCSTSGPLSKASPSTTEGTASPRWSSRKARRRSSPTTTSPRCPSSGCNPASTTPWPSATAGSIGCEKLER